MGQAWQLELAIPVGMEHLNFPYRVVAPGRALVHRICNTLWSTCSPMHRIWVSEDIKDNLHMWVKYDNQAVVQVVNKLTSDTSWSSS